MRFSSVIKIIMSFLFLTLMVFFVFENLDPVPIWIPFIKDRHFGLIYIILACYLLGMSNAFWVLTVVGAQRRKKMKLKQTPQSEESLFEDEE